MNKCSISKKTHFICNRLILSKVSCFNVKAYWWYLFQGCLFIIRLMFSRKCGLFIRWRHYFGLFLPCTLIIWFIRRCFQQVVWGRLRRRTRRNFNIILCHTDTFLFPHCIIITKCVFQLFLSFIDHEHHIRSLCMLIFSRVNRWAILL